MKSEDRFQSKEILEGSWSKVDVQVRREENVDLCCFSIFFKKTTIKTF